MKVLAVAAFHGIIAPALILGADTGGGNEVALLLNYGVLGLVSVLWLLGRVETPKRGDKAELRAEAAEARERALHELIRTEVVPALTRFTEVAARILERDHR